jgi:P4 family phage/plasmid primase-like protien
MTNKTLLEYALEAQALGLHIFPLQARTKDKHVAASWKGENSSADPERARLWWHRDSEFNFGVNCGESGITVLDVDEGLNSKEDFDAWRVGAGLPETYTVHTGRRTSYGVHMYFRGQKGNTGKWTLHGCHGEIRGGVLVDGEIKSGGYVVGVGSIHPDSSERWEVINDAPFADLPEIVKALEADKVGKTAVRVDLKKTGVPTDRKKMVEGDGRNNAATSYAGKIFNEGITDEKEMFRSLRAWNRSNCEDLLSDAELQGIARSALNFKPALSTKVSPEWEPITAPGPQEQDPQRAAAGPAQASPKPLKRFADTDTGNMERLVYWFGDGFKYCPQSSWFMWDGKRWVADSIGKVQAAAQLIARAIVQNELPLALAELDRSGEDFEKIQAATIASLAKFAKASESRKGVDAMKSFAKAAAGIAADIMQFDRNNWSFNCENVTLKLYNVERDCYELSQQTHTPSDMITCISPVVYDPAATCPQWDHFLDQIMSGNADNIGFLQRAAGYSLTGSAAEHCMFFLYGNGRNGKSTFVEVLKYIMGDYGKAASMGMFLDTDYTTIPSELAGLAGKRFVSASETKEGRAWDEAKLKQITGGDTLSVRFLYSKEFEYKPEFKIWCSGNHRPVIRGMDDGVWSRLKLVPFTWQVAEAQKDKFLRGKLQKEAPGILNWMLRGLEDWHKDGLRDPVEVVAAAVDYRNEESWLTQFLAAETETGSSYSEQAKDLYARYKTWAANAGEKHRSGIVFNRTMDAAGIKSSPPTAKVKTYLGVRCRPMGSGSVVPDIEM